MSDRVSAGQGETAEQALATELRERAEHMLQWHGSAMTLGADEVIALCDAVERLLVRVRELTDERDEAVSQMNATLKATAQSLVDESPLHRRVQEAERALELMLAAIRAHSRWCGYRAEAPGDGMLYRAIHAAEAVLGGEARQQANELEPIFKVQVRLDGDDWPPTMIENVRFALIDALEKMKDDDLILDYTIDNE